MNSQANRTRKLIEFFVGAVALFLANMLSLLIFNNSVIDKILEYDTSAWRQYMLIITASYILIFFTFSQPLNLRKRDRLMETFATIRNCLLTYALFAVLLIFTKNQIIESRYLFLSSSVSYIVLSLIGRYIAKKLMLRAISNSRFATLAGIITTTQLADDFVEAVKTDWSRKYTGIALIDAVYDGGKYKTAKSNNVGSALLTETLEEVDEINGIPVTANRENLIGWLMRSTLDEVYINVPEDYRGSELNKLVEELEEMGIVAYVSIPSLKETVSQSKFDNLDCQVRNGYPLAVFSPVVHNEALLSIKRLFDIIGGIVGSLIALILVMIVAIPLKKESPGPIIFKQKRIGKNGRTFNIYKIRSMYVDAEERKKELMAKNEIDGYMFKLEEDPRITKVGRFIRKYSIDEFPQFWNVLKGDMSLVGTRPPTVDEFEKYESHHKRRLSLKPGITGMWQVSGRSDIQDFEEVVRLDCEYIDTWSIWLDIKILFKTVFVVLTHKGAK